MHTHLLKIFWLFYLYEKFSPLVFFGLKCPKKNSLALKKTFVKLKNVIDILNMRNICSVLN